MTGRSDLAARLSAWRPPEDTIGIVALGQAGFALRGRDDLVLIDPFLSPRDDRLAVSVVDPRDLGGVGAILATHEHLDHLDLPAWPALARASPAATFVVPAPLVEAVAATGIPRSRILGAGLGESLSAAGVRMTAVPACHAISIEDGYAVAGADGVEARFVGYVVELDGVRVYHAGDTLRYEQQVGIVGSLIPEVGLLPINGRDADRERRGIVGNMTAEEAAALARDLDLALAIPMHHDGIQGNLGSPGAFVDELRRLGSHVSVSVPALGAGVIWPASGEAWRDRAATA